MENRTAAEALARRIAALRAEDLPGPLRRVLEDLVLDIAGLCIAARATDYVRAVLDSSESDGSCTIIGHARTTDAGGAALANGTAAHGEDFDDTFEQGPVHAGAVIVPAVLAAAERYGRDGPAALLGLAVGVETICRLSLVTPRRAHQAGFHATSVFGPLAVAAAVGATLGFPERQIVDALGIAGSMAGGLLEFLADGAWTKRLHPGWAAQAGIKAALLARHGFVGPHTVLDGAHGLFHGFARTREGDYRRLTDGFGEEWLGETLAFKPYACGTTLHPYIDCAIRLGRRGIPLDAITDVVCETGEGTIERLWEPLAAKQAPPTPYAAKFSPPFCMAAGFVLGDVGLAAFTEETLRDPRIRCFAAKVRYAVERSKSQVGDLTGHLHATLADGRVIEERQPHLRGGAREPLPRAAIEEKFFANASFGGWPREKAGTALDRLRELFSGPLDLAPLRG